MAKIRMYNFVTADGFYAGLNDEIDWFTHERIDIDGQEDLDHLRPKVPTTLIFGRNTYEMMREYWSSAQAMEDDPLTTSKMRESTKIVFSRTLNGTGEGPTWKDVTLLRSFDAGLLDELEFMVVPIILAEGKPLLSPNEISNLVLSEERQYQNGIVSRTYSVNP